MDVVATLSYCALAATTALAGACFARLWSKRTKLGGNTALAYAIVPIVGLSQSLGFMYQPPSWRLFGGLLVWTVILGIWTFRVLPNWLQR